jgi:hypothetical protein
MVHTGEVEWEAAHCAVVRLAAARAAHEHALGAALLRAFRAEVWRPMGMASFHEYAERFVGLTPRQTEERLRVAVALEDLPRTSERLAEGRVHFSAVRELTRVSAPDTETEWLAVAEGKSVGEIGKLVSGRREGTAPAIQCGPRRSGTGSSSSFRPRRTRPTARRRPRCGKGRTLA